MTPGSGLRRLMAGRRLLAGLLVIALLSPWLAAGSAAAAEEEDEELAAMQARAEAVFDRLVEALAPEHDVAGDFTVQVVRERVPNAWINRDNEIFVTSGLMELLVTDDQLAGVIGHEMAHGILDHIPHRINQRLWSAFATMALGVVADVKGDPDWDGLMNMWALFTYAYSREQESEADLVGMRYAEAAGYDPEGLVEALQLIDRERRRLPSDSIWNELYRAHPPIPQRVSDLRLVLTMERLAQAPLSGATFATRRGASDAHAAAVDFARGLLGGDWDVVATLTPTGAVDVVAPANRWDELEPYFDERWAQADAKVIEHRRGADGQPLSLDETLVVRLARPADRFGGEEGTGGEANAAVERAVWVDVAVTVRRSAAGWFVVGWDIQEDAD